LSITFDGNGNPTTYSGKNLTFDIENRLVSITSPAFSAAYAPDDRRTSKTANGTTTYYLYDEDDGASPLLEEQGTGTVSMGYGMAGDGLRARYAPQSGGLYYLFQWDPQGSLVQRQTGGPVGNTSYALDTAMFDGYGAKLGDTDAFTGGAEATRDAMGFQGQFGAYTDNETGLVLMGHRYYDAGTGRFLTRDPLGYGGGINLYGFTGNNPVNESDPSGYQGTPDVYDKDDAKDDKIETTAERDDRIEREMPDSLSPENQREMEINRRINDRLNGPNKKTLQNFAASLRRSQFWQGRTDFSGKAVFQRNDLIDPARKDATGRTSLQRMEDQGQPPIGPDGKPVVLHHLTQDDEGPMAEMEQTFHDKYRRIIHINTNTKGSNINRSGFRAWSKRYWRMRAGDFR